MFLLATGSKSQVFPLNFVFHQKLEYCTYIDLGGIIKFANSKEAMVKWVLNRLFQHKYVQALKDISNTSNTMYTLSKCNQAKDITKSNDNILQIKKIIVSCFISPFDSDLHYTWNLFNIVASTAALEIVQDCLLSVKDTGKTLKESFKRKITGNSNVEFFFSN